jgi:dTDP-glucose 4,6-dehydratase
MPHALCFITFAPMAEKHILITGGAGFIGSHLVRHFVTKYPQYHIVNLDALTYAGNLENLSDIEGAANYTFIKGDIQDAGLVGEVFQDQQITHVIHCAAESHVDRSILDPLSFVKTNVIGTVNLLHAARSAWNDEKDHLFYQISTDEVYGALGDTGYFTEETAFDPRSPYSASKASADHLVSAWFHTYKMPVVISNCSNNYGPYQFPEKLIPLMIRNIIAEKPLPVYGEGTNVRDWLYVTDHVEAMDLIFHKGKAGETYTIGGDNEKRNIDLVHLLCDQMDQALGRESGTSRKLITHVRDREGHDFRYAIDATKIHTALGWTPQTRFDDGIKQTVKWYLEHQPWVEHIVSGAYQTYYEAQYATR